MQFFRNPADKPGVHAWGESVPLVRDVRFFRLRGNPNRTFAPARQGGKGVPSWERSTMGVASAGPEPAMAGASAGSPIVPRARRAYALTAPPNLNGKKALTLKREAPTIWELQTAMAASEQVEATTVRKLPVAPPHVGASALDGNGECSIVHSRLLIVVNVVLPAHINPVEGNHLQRWVTETRVSGRVHGSTHINPVEGNHLQCFGHSSHWLR